MSAVITQDIPHEENPVVAPPDASEPAPQHPADQAAAEIQEHLDRMISTVAYSPAKQQEDTQRRAQYRQRLQSFTTVGYFAPPIHLSPILCALTGWELPPKNEAESTAGKRSNAPLSPSSSPCESAARLSCASCHAQVTLWIPSVLSTTGQADLIREYQQLLWKSHAMQCRHRKEAEYLINTALQPLQKQPNVASLVIPTLLARSLSAPSSSSDAASSSLELVEHPASIFAKKWQHFYPHLADCSGIPVELPAAVLQFGTDTSASDKTLLARLVDIMPKETTLDQPVAEAAAALVLMGWDLLSPDHLRSTEVTSIHCIVCLAQHPLTRSTRKRPRDAVFSLWHQPWAAHRYYCPWVCGFPQTGTTTSSRPLWEIVAEGLLRSTCRPDDDEDRSLPSSDVRQLIRAGVSPMRYTAVALRKG